jgi:hypothetical protein
MLERARNKLLTTVDAARSSYWRCGCAVLVSVDPLTTATIGTFEADRPSCGEERSVSFIRTPSEQDCGWHYPRQSRRPKLNGSPTVRTGFKVALGQRVGSHTRTVRL